MTALFLHSQVRVFLGVSTLLGVSLIVLQALGIFTRVDQALLNSYGPLEPSIFLDSGILLYWSIVPGMLLLYIGVRLGMIVTVLLWGGYLSLALWVGQPYQISLPMMAAGVATLLSIARAMDWRGTFLDREQEDINLLFGGFLEPHLVHQLQRNPDLISPEGVKKTVTILFADIRGFTALTETLSPEQLLDMLHTYFRYMIPLVQKHGGTVNKLIGDSIMAFFGDPIPQENHAERAALAALDMQRAMEAITQEWHKYGLGYVKIGIGIHTGPVVVGDIGHDPVHAYTVLGRHVNLAAQLEVTCPDGEIYLSNDTYQQLHERFTCKAAGEHVYRHAVTPVPVYRLINRKL
jgi:adenylate cyclase